MKLAIRTISAQDALLAHACHLDAHNFHKPRHGDHDVSAKGGFTPVAQVRGGREALKPDVPAQQPDLAEHAVRTPVSELQWLCQRYRLAVGRYGLDKAILRQTKARIAARGMPLKLQEARYHCDQNPMVRQGL